MNPNTLITIFWSFIAVIAMNIILIIIDTKKNKDGKRKRRIYYNILKALGVLIIIIIVLYFYSSDQQKKENYNHVIDQATIEFDSKDYLSAAKIYHNASTNAYDIETEVESTYKEGMCFTLQGMNNSKPEYYPKAVEIYSSIINNPEYMESEFYLDAAIDMSGIFYLTNISCDNADWVSLIQLLEDNIDLEDSKDVPKGQKLKAAQVLALYFEKASHADKENSQNTIFLSKTLTYYKLFSDWYTRSSTETDLNLTGMSTFNIINITDSLLDYAPFTADPVELANGAIKLCKSEMKRLGDQTDLVEYIQLKKNLGKGYWILGTCEKNNEHLKKSYEILKSILYITDEKAQIELLDVAYYLILGGQYSEEDLTRALDVYEYNVSNLPVSTYRKLRIKILISASTACRWILENHGDYERAFVLGRAFSKELKTILYDLLDDDEREDTKELYDYFYKK